MDKHIEICKELNEIYKAKNSDYGNSFSYSFNEFGLISAVVRISDKTSRLKRLVNPHTQSEVKNESIRDTLMDLANYAIMSVMEIDSVYDCYGIDGGIYE